MTSRSDRRRIATTQQTSRRLGSRREVFANQQIDRTEVEIDKSRARRWRILLWLSVALVFMAVDLLLALATLAVGRFTGSGPKSLLGAMVNPIGPWWLAVLLLLAIPGITWGILSLLMRRQMAAQAAMNSVDDINQHAGDARLVTPAELVQRYQWFPDAGSHADIDVTAIVSHILIDDSDRNLGKVVMSDGSPVQVDGELGRELLVASGLDPDQVKDVMRHGRQRLGSDPELGKVRDQVARTWSHPNYEPARPAGAYLVDTAPANTTVIGITRSGKGQTLVLPWCDVQLRSEQPANIVFNDPKGEIAAAMYAPATARGFDVVQFNLINPPKTDRYNPLGMAAMAACNGEYQKCATYIENIATTFFPPNPQDPFWSNAAGSAAKRAFLAIIDMLLSREHEINIKAAAENWTPSRKNVALDNLWAGATLYNAFQFFITLSSITVESPAVRAEKFASRFKEVTGDPGDDTSPRAEVRSAMMALVDAETSTLWAGHTDDTMDGLSLYFRAMRQLPRSEVRRLAVNEDASLRAMGGSERTISSVYGIALAAMNYFSDPTVMMLTSGPPSETVDISGLSFPRRLAVRFDPAYVRDRALGGSQVRWSAWADPLFVEPLGDKVRWQCADKCSPVTVGRWPDDGMCPECESTTVTMLAPDPDFSHTDTLTSNGWAYFYLSGIFPADSAYLSLEVVSAVAGTTVEAMCFRFDKSYRRADRGRTLVTKPLTGERIVRDGLLTEITAGGAPNVTMYTAEVVTKDDGVPALVEKDIPVLRSTGVRYSESPKAMFMITPPHLDKYARLLLVLLRDMVDLNFEAAYMTRTNQKPDLGTKFMLDEIGNLKSEGNGLRGFETLLSIGLGQSQQFHLILQSLQQLTEIYGGSVESILQSNTANLIFLKSTDVELIEKLSKMSGHRHVAYRGSKTVTRDMEDLFKFKDVEGRVSYTMALEQENVILFNDLAFLPDRNWVVLRNGEYPVWNRDETVMPMAYKLLERQPPAGAPTFSLQNLPSLSNAGAYDPRQDTPNFERALSRICAQAMVADQAKADYQEVTGIAEDEATYLDPDFYAEQVMSLVEINRAEYQSLDELMAELAEEYGAWKIGAGDGAPRRRGGSMGGSTGGSDIDKHADAESSASTVAAGSETSAQGATGGSSRGATGGASSTTTFDDDLGDGAPWDFDEPGI